MNELWPQLIPGILTVLLGSSGFFGSLAIWRKMNPSTDSIIVANAKESLKMAREISEDLRKDIEVLRDDIDEANGKIEESRVKINLLEEQNRNCHRELEKLRREIERRKIPRTETPG